MDFSLSAEHKLLQNLYRDFARTEVAPLAEETDEEEKFPVDTVKKLARYGFMGIPFPKIYGGQGCDNLAYSMAVEELSKACATTGVVVSAHTSLCCAPIYTFGTEEQKQKYLIPVARGEKIGAFGLTEPGAGTDAAGQQTKAVLIGDTSHDKEVADMLGIDCILIANGHQSKKNLMSVGATVIDCLSDIRSVLLG